MYDECHSEQKYGTAQTVTSIQSVPYIYAQIGTIVQMKHALSGG